MFHHLLVVWEPSARMQNVMSELAQMIDGCDTKVTIYATETLPEVAMERAAAHGDVLGIVASMFSTIADSATHSYKPPHHVFDALKEDLLKHLEAESRILRSHGLTAQCVVQFGDLGPSALQYARSNDVDAIVLPASWVGDLRRLAHSESARLILDDGVDPLVIVPMRVDDRLRTTSPA